MFSNIEKTVRSTLPCRPREGGYPVTFAAKPLDSRLRGNDTERPRSIAFHELTVQGRRSVSLPKLAAHQEQ
jgi:hypothetical protein